MITISAHANSPDWTLLMTCSSRKNGGCRSELRSRHSDIEDVHTSITRLGWLRGVDLGDERKNADLCPPCAANYREGGCAMVDDI